MLLAIRGSMAGAAEGSGSWREERACRVGQESVQLDEQARRRMLNAQRAVRQACGRRQRHGADDPALIQASSACAPRWRGRRRWLTPTGAARRAPPRSIAQPSPCAKPCRQLGYRSCQPSSRFAFSFEAPRTSVMMTVVASPAASLPSQRGTRLGGSSKVPSRMLIRSGSSRWRLKRAEPQPPQNHFSQPPSGPRAQRVRA